MEDYTLSVIVPNYNNEKYLKLCVESILRQSYAVEEIIIVDDCSTDKSGEIISELTEQYAKVKPQLLDKNGGVSHARNVGISKAKSKYITFLDADDMMSNVKKLENEMRLIKEHYEEGKDVAAYSKVVYIDEEGNHLPNSESRIAYSGEIYKKLLCTYNTTIIPRDFCIKKDIIETLGGYREDMNLYEDYELTLRIARQFFFYDTAQTGTAYRLKKSGLSFRTRKECNRVFMSIFYNNLKIMSLPERADCILKKYSSYVQRNLKPQVIEALRALKRLLKKTAVYRLKEYLRERQPIILFNLIVSNLFREGKRTTGKSVITMRDYSAYHKVDYQVVEKEMLRPVYIAPYFEKGVEEIKEIATPEIYLARINKVSIIGGCGAIFTRKNCILDMLASDTENRVDYVTFPTCYYYHNKLYVKYADRDNSIAKGIFLCGVAPFNYYHFMVEMMSRLQYVERRIADKTIPLLIDDAAYQYPQMAELISLLNRYQRPVVRIKNSILYKIEELIYPSMNSWFPVNIQIGMINRYTDFGLAESALTNLRNALLPDVIDNNSNRKIYISRKKRDLSRLINEDEVERLFVAYGYEVIYPEELSFTEQMHTFYQADRIAGTSGAAFTNIIFCRPETKIACIIPEEYRFYLYSTIAHLLCCEFVFLDAQIANRGENAALSQFKVDETYCKRFLKYMEEK